MRTAPLPGVRFDVTLIYMRSAEVGGAQRCDTD